MKGGFPEIEAEIIRTLGRYSKLGNDLKGLVSLSQTEKDTKKMYLNNLDFELGPKCLLRILVNSTTNYGKYRKLL
jgi:hypothetical protein